MFQLVEEARLEVEIKKSRFIAVCVPVASQDEIGEALKRLKCEDATHNCWAWRLGDLYPFNDDGERGGSAGRPMLAAIDGQKYDGVLAHVVRYFGGIKLGVGGLVRAYGNTVAECLRTAVRKEMVALAELQFCVGFSDTYAVYGIITQYHLVKLSEEYTADGVAFRLSIEVDLVENIRRLLTDATRARVQWTES